MSLTYEPASEPQVRFSFDDTYVVSCGNNDRAVFQWRVSSDKVVPCTLP